MLKREMEYVGHRVVARGAKTGNLKVTRKETSVLFSVAPYFCVKASALLFDLGAKYCVDPRGIPVTECRGYINFIESCFTYWNSGDIDN
jgi:hypothetical protein